MSKRTQIEPGQKLDLVLTEAERLHLLDDLTCLDTDLEVIVRDTTPGQPIKMTLDDLDVLGGFVAAEANHTKNKKLEKKLDVIFAKITGLLDNYTDEPPPQTMKIEDAKKKKVLSEPKPKRGKEPKAKAHDMLLYQFKISLLESEPRIWRRIQVENGTLDDLHEHIQTAMGWTNSHLHQFEIEGKLYGDPDLLEDMDGVEFEDSTSTWLSEILPAGGKRFRFSYEYDFGDSWRHEVLFEGCPAPAKGKKYPLCLEGERACPPEDCGGVGGYGEFLKAITDPKHEEHESMLEWVGGKFDPEKFSSVKATKEMKKGLPDWRTMM